MTVICVLLSCQGIHSESLRDSLEATDHLASGNFSRLSCSAMASTMPLTLRATLAAPARTLTGVSAASGLEIADDGVTGYVVGDDSVWLYVISVAPGADISAVQKRIRLTTSREVDSAGERTEGIAKKVKPDFECIVSFNFEGKNVVCTFGSGSKVGMRDGIILLDPATRVVREFDGRALMDALRADKRICGAAKLNLEAAALVGDGSTLALFQRGNTPGAFNAVALIQLEHFTAYLRQLAALDSLTADPAAERPTAPSYSVVHLQLPPIIEPTGEHRAFGAGVSGASTVTLPLGGGAAGGAGAGAGEEFLILSASYEGTMNEIDDGPVMGSRLALLPSRRLLAMGREAAAAAAAAPAGAAAEGGAGAGPSAGAGAGPAAASAAIPSLDLSHVSALILAPESPESSPQLVKVEGVAARSVQLSADGAQVVIDALCVTDPDGDESQILEVTVAAPVEALRAIAGL